jgi:hypothetical protein
VVRMTGNNDAGEAGHEGYDVQGACGSI